MTPREPFQMPHRLLIRVLIDGLLLTSVVGAGVLAKAWAAGQLSTSGEFPWTPVLLLAGQILTAGLTWYLRGEVKELHITFNSQMDQYKKLIEDAAEAKGALAARTEDAALAAAKEAGVVEGGKK